MNEFPEQKIINAVRELLSVRVNEIFKDWELLVPVIEFGNIGSRFAVAPVVSLLSCERSEKERILLIDAYSLSVSFTLQENEDSELYCYAYASAFEKALGDDVTLGEIVDRAVITGKKYMPPKNLLCGEGWGLFFTLRITVEK